jgi:phosphopentomutase
VKRLYWFVLDSLGIGGAPDAEEYGDAGSDTLGHIAEWFVKNEGRSLDLPNLKRLGAGCCLPAGPSANNLWGGSRNVSQEHLQ